MAAPPWGSSPYYSPQQGQYPHNAHPNNDPRRHTQFPQPTLPGFYNPALSAVQQFPHPQHSPYGPVPPSQYSPPVPTPHIPPVLKPGGGSRSPSIHVPRSNSGDLFFQATPAFPQAQAPHQQHHQHPIPPPLRHAQSNPPPVPHKSFNSPPVPPKPSYTSPPGNVPQLPIYPHQIAASFHHSTSLSPSSVHEAGHSPVYSDLKQPHAHLDGPYSAGPSDVKHHHHTHVDPAYTPPKEADEEAEFKRILELSARESEMQRQRTLSQEDAELARAMKESLRTSVRFPIPSSGQIVEAGPSMSFPLPEVSSPLDVRSPLPSSTVSPLLPHSTPPTSVHSLDSHELSREDPQSGPFTASPSTSAGQIAADEAFARRLMEEENQRTNEMTKHAPPSAPAPLEEIPPLYNDVIAASGPLSAPIPNPLSGNSLFPPTPVVGPSSPSPAHSRASSPPPPLIRSTSANAIAPAPTTSLVETRTGRSQSFGAFSTGSTSPSLRSDVPVSAISGAKSAGSSSLSVVPEAGEKAGDRSSVGKPPMTSHASEPLMTANQYVDAEILRGVTLGFGPPAISTTLASLQGPIPNVIALPYGRCPPFHLKAPSWRDLLKLMARLSGTRLEPTIEAMAVVKTEMRVRVVVNFVKVHQSSVDWHVVLYMTIDHPVPQNHPSAWKYRNGDPSTLPFSYTMSSVPAFLREGADAPMSKWYNIPASSQTPLPTLPISFPNLATYLMAALEDSRRAMHDGSSGTRRLAKTIDMCYPNEQPADDETEERHGMRGLLGRLTGRSSKQARDRNADTFDVVTPFVPDEWGG